LKLQEPSLVGLEVLAPDARRLGARQVLSQSDELLVEDFDAGPLLLAPLGIHQRVVAVLEPLEVGPVVFELLAVARVAGVKVIQDVPGHLRDVYLHLEGRGAGGLLDPDYLVERVVHGPLSNEDDEAGQHEDQDQDPEAEPEFARYGHVLPFAWVDWCHMERPTSQDDPSPTHLLRGILR